MDFKRIIIEFRPRLQSCHVFISFHKDIDKNDIKLHILQKSIILKYTGNHEKDVDEQLKSIDLNSDNCESLTYSKSDITFRLQTDPNDTNKGSFRTELFTKMEDVSHQSSDRYQINVKSSKSYSFNCKQCKREIFTTKGFKRILELPSENLDMSDWFCHDCDKQKTKKNILDPNEDELFYKDYFVVINRSLLPDIVNKEDEINCSNCEFNLGIKVRTGLKLYNSKIDVKDLVDSACFSLFSYANSNHEVVLQDFIHMTKKNMNLFKHVFVIPQICKIIYETKILGEKQYLLLLVVDKKAQILTAKKNFKLHFVESSKLLFKVEKDGDKIYEEWKAESDNNHIIMEEIPNDMFYAGCQHLKSMSENVAEQHRVVDEFVMTYLELIPHM